MASVPRNRAANLARPTPCSSAGVDSAAGILQCPLRYTLQMAC